MSMDYDNSARPGAYRALTAMAVGINLLGGVEVVYAGPCTTEIARVEQKIREVQATAPPGGPGEPSCRNRSALSCTISRRPVGRGRRSKASAEAAAALDRARKADAAGDAKACANALQDAKDLYGIE